jgi:hypothetical protein
MVTQDHHRGSVPVDSLLDNMLARSWPLTGPSSMSTVQVSMLVTARSKICSLYHRLLAIPILFLTDYISATVVVERGNGWHHNFLILIPNPEYGATIGGLLSQRKVFSTIFRLDSIRPTVH